MQENEKKEVKDKKAVPVKEVKEKKEVKVQAKTPKNKIIKTKRFILKPFLLHASIGGYNAGTTIKLECCKKSGSLRSGYWRKRLKEAEIDGCIEAL